MSKTIDFLKATWPDWLNASVGLWLLGSALFPRFVGSSAGAWSAAILGLAVLVVSLLAVVRVRPWKEWTNMALGVALVVACWPLHTALWSDPFWNFAGDGVFLAGHAAYQLLHPPQEREGA